MARARDILYLARKGRGFSQQELARLSGVGQPKISAYERGEVEPRFDVLEKLVGHCGMRLAVRLEDNSSPPLPRLACAWRLKRLQWAIARWGRGRGLLDVRAVPPVGEKAMTVVVRTGGRRWDTPGRVARELAAYLRYALGTVPVVDLASVSEPEREELLAASVPVAFVGRERPVRETRFEPPTPDERWYATRLLDALPGRLYGPRACPPHGFGLVERYRYRRAVEAEAKAAMEEERERSEDDRWWRELDEWAVVRVPRP